MEARRPKGLTLYPKSDKFNYAGGRIT